jgi:twinkle protein
MELVNDSFDFSKWLRVPNDDYRLNSPAKSIADVIDMFYGETKDEGALLPWIKTHKLIRFRKGEVTVWCGINGHGKSNITSQVALDLAWQGERVCIASMEMLPKRTLWRMVRQAAGMNDPSISYIRQFIGWLNQRVWMFDHQGIVGQPLILGTIRYAVHSLKVNHFFIDSLMKTCRGEDDYNGQKDFMDQLTSIARDLGIHIHVVHHVRKGDNEYAVPGKFDGKGSGAIADQTDNWVTVWRNKRKEIALVSNPTDKVMLEPDCILGVDKQRNGEWEGRIGLWYEASSMSYVEHRGQRPRHYELALEEVCVRDQANVAGGKAAVVSSHQANAA